MRGVSDERFTLKGSTPGQCLDVVYLLRLSLLGFAQTFSMGSTEFRTEFSEKEDPLALFSFFFIFFFVFRSNRKVKHRVS